MICRATLSRCVCEVAGPHTDHHCECGGSWRDGGIVLAYPGGLTEEEAREEAIRLGWQPPGTEEP